MAEIAWQVMDDAADVSRGLAQLGVQSLEGMFDRAYMQTPDLSGLRNARVASQSIISVLRSQYEQILFNALRSAERDARLTGLATRESTLGIVSDAQDAFQHYFAGIATGFARRFRARLITAGQMNTKRIGPLTRNGRSVTSEDWAYLSARKAVIDCVNLARLDDLKSQGKSSFTIVNRNPEHEDWGLIFSIEAYPDMEVEHFHPRTYSLVGEGA